MCFGVFKDTRPKGGGHKKRKKERKKALQRVAECRGVLQVYCSVWRSVMFVTECLKTQDQREEGIKKERKKEKKRCNVLQSVTVCCRCIALSRG